MRYSRIGGGELTLTINGKDVGRNDVAHDDTYICPDGWKFGTIEFTDLLFSGASNYGNTGVYHVYKSNNTAVVTNLTKTAPHLNQVYEVEDGTIIIQKRNTNGVGWQAEFVANVTLKKI